MRAGKIHYVGLSNFTGWQLQKTVDDGGVRAGFPARHLQPQYNLLARAIEWEIVPACQSAGSGCCAWSPLASGWLTGKYQRDQPPAGGTRAAENADLGMKIWNQRGHLEQTWQVLDAVRKVADERGVSMSQVAIAWLLARPAVSSVILGARTLRQLEENMAAAEVRLSAGGDAAARSGERAAHARLPVRRARPDPAQPPHPGRQVLAKDGPGRAQPRGQYQP